MRIAFIGTGLMGEPMAQRLLTKHDLIVFNRTASKTNSLKEAGAEVANTSIDAIKKADVIITMLTDYNACSKMLVENDLHLEGKVVIQMSTIKPDENAKLADELMGKGAKFIEAPVLGSIPQATAGELFILVGGDSALAEQMNPILKLMGNSITYFGEVGAASAAKLALNQLIVTLTSAFSMSLGYLLEKNVDVEKFLTILRGSALYAPTFDKKLNMMLNRNFENPNFPLKHLVKDVNLIAEDFNEAGIDASILRSIQGILKNSINIGDAEMDYSAIYNSIHKE